MVNMALFYTNICNNIVVYSSKYQKVGQWPIICVFLPWWHRLNPKACWLSNAASAPIPLPRKRPTFHPPPWSWKISTFWDPPTCNTSNMTFLQIITGWWFFATPLKNHGVKVSWDDEIPNIWKNKKCSKPPTSIYMNKHHCSWCDRKYACYDEYHYRLQR